MHEDFADHFGERAKERYATDILVLQNDFEILSAAHDTFGTVNCAVDDAVEEEGQEMWQDV